MLTLHDLSFSRGDKAVIKSLTYTFKSTGIIVISGPSGIGKTTLLHLLAGLLKPSGGSVEGHYRKVAVAFQEPRLLNWLNAKENINFVLPKDNQGSNIASELLAAFDLSAKENSLPSALSGGEKQRLSLARALAVKADLLLLDEPFSALDEALKARTAAVIKAANKEGLTIVVSHDKEAARLLDAEVLSLDSTPITTLKAL